MEMGVLSKLHRSFAHAQLCQHTCQKQLAKIMVKGGYDDAACEICRDVCTIYVLDKLELAVPLPKLRCILRIRDFHAVNPICAANVQLRLWLALP